MKTRICIITLLIFLASIAFTISAWAQQAQAHAAILIVIHPRPEELKDKSTNSYEEITVVKEDSTITVVPCDKEEQSPELKMEMEDAFDEAWKMASLNAEEE